mmetsp:Transcript_3580/g.5697  ORF Transcript_3580/g.5697 Transcript_3580/m.5697 type:complete len:82 (-) Transcript_3580:51-296(-)
MILKDTSGFKNLRNEIGRAVLLQRPFATSSSSSLDVLRFLLFHLEIHGRTLLADDDSQYTTRMESIDSRIACILLGTVESG